jgi:hypothetical protein
MAEFILTIPTAVRSGFGDAMSQASVGWPFSGTHVSTACKITRGVPR